MTRGETEVISNIHIKLADWIESFQSKGEQPNDNSSYYITISDNQGPHKGVVITVNIFYTFFDGKAPNNMIAKPMYFALQCFYDEFGDMFKEYGNSNDPEVRSGLEIMKRRIHFKVGNVGFKLGNANGIYFLDNYINSGAYRALREAEHPIRDLKDYDSVRQGFWLDPRDYPKIDDNVMSYIDGMKKKIAKINLALRKGTFEGHTYDAGTTYILNIGHSNAESSTYTMTADNFNFTLKPYTLLIDGKRANLYDPITQKIEEMLIKRYAHFKIKFDY